MAFSGRRGRTVLDDGSTREGVAGECREAALAFINGVGPRVAESGLGLIPGHAYSAPYEDVTLSGK